MNPSAGVQLLERINTFVVNPIIALIFTLGLFLFFYGIVEFLWGVKDGSPKDEGKNHMVWGLVGMLVMVSVYGIINIIVNTFEIDSAVDTSRIQDVDPGINFFRGGT